MEIASTIDTQRAVLSGTSSLVVPPETRRELTSRLQSTEQASAERCLSRKGKGARCIRAFLGAIDSKRKCPKKTILTAWQNFKQCAQEELEGCTSCGEPLKLLDLVFANPQRSLAVMVAQGGGNNYFFLIPLEECGQTPGLIARAPGNVRVNQIDLRRQITALQETGALCRDTFQVHAMHPAANDFNLCRSRIFENEGVLAIALNSRGIKHFHAIDTLLTHILPRANITESGIQWSPDQSVNAAVIGCVDELVTLAELQKIDRFDVARFIYSRGFYAAAKDFLQKNCELIVTFLHDTKFQEGLHKFREAFWTTAGLSDERLAVELVSNAMVYCFEGCPPLQSSDTQFHHQHLIPYFEWIIQKLKEDDGTKDHVPEHCGVDLPRDERLLHDRFSSCWKIDAVPQAMPLQRKELGKFLARWPEEMKSCREEIAGKDSPMRTNVLGLLQRLHLVHEHNRQDSHDGRSFAEHVITSMVLAHDPLHPGRPICGRLFGGRARYFPDAPPYPPHEERTIFQGTFVEGIRYVFSARRYDEFESRWLELTSHIRRYLFAERLDENIFNFPLPDDRTELARRFRTALSPHEVAEVYNSSSHMSPFWVHRHCQSGYKEWLEFAHDRAALDFIHGLRMEVLGRKGLHAEVGELTQKLMYRIGFDIADPLEDLTTLTDLEIIQALFTVTHTMRHRTDKFTLNGRQLGHRPVREWTQKDLQEYVEKTFLYRMPGLEYVRNGPFSLACYFGAGFACPCFIRWSLANTDGQRVT